MVKVVLHAVGQLGRRRTLGRQRLPVIKPTASGVHAWGVRFIAVAVLITVTAVVAVVHKVSPPASSVSPVASSPKVTGGPVQFSTLPPGAKLPSGAECARLVRASSSPENRPGNVTFNRTTGQRVGPGFFPAGDSPQVKALLPRIDGDFTGTTEDILRWAACKWGISQDVVFAQAAAESWWEQPELGDWGTQAGLCPPGHGLGANGRPRECPQSYGILQDKFYFEEAGWPGIGTSTAMNVDAAYAIWRSCYDGYEVWLNDEPRGQQYYAGNLWGCVGRWYAGSWYTPAADRYISVVQEYLRQRIWRQPGFGQGS